MRDAIRSRVAEFSSVRNAGGLTHGVDDATLKVVGESDPRDRAEIALEPTLCGNEHIEDGQGHEQFLNALASRRADPLRHHRRQFAHNASSDHQQEIGRHGRDDYPIGRFRR